jgi:hypothetical protein
MCGRLANAVSPRRGNSDSGPKAMEIVCRYEENQSGLYCRVKCERCASTLARDQNLANVGRLIKAHPVNRPKRHCRLGKARVPAAILAISSSWNRSCSGVNKSAKVVLVCWKRTEKLRVFVLDFLVFFGVRGRILTIRNVGPGLREFLVEL